MKYKNNLLEKGYNILITNIEKNLLEYQTIHFFVRKQYFFLIMNQIEERNVTIYFKKIEGSCDAKQKLYPDKKPHNHAF